MKYLLILFVAVGLSACDLEEINRSRNPSVYYIQDPQTSLCFAAITKRPDAFTHVPCTPEVLNLLKR